MNDPKVIVALDFDDRAALQSLLSKLNPHECRVKVGKELFTLFGPDIVKSIHDMGFQVFLDLKFHDIPATVKKACKAAASLGVWMLNVHALGGREMLLAAREGASEGNPEVKLIAVTILTSSNDDDIHRVGLSGEVKENVLRLASLVQEVSLDGVVCSAQEASMLRKATDEQFLLVTPGIRPSGFQLDDQKRILSPSEAISCGSSYLVVGRPITQSNDPAKVLLDINQEIEGM